MKWIKHPLINCSLCTTALFVFNPISYAASANFIDGQEHHLSNETYTDGGQGNGALRVFGQDTTVIGDSLTMKPTSYSSGGAYAGTGGKIVLTNSSVVSEQGNYVYGLWSRWDNANAQSTIEATKTNVTTAGSNSHAAVAQDGGYISLLDSALFTSGSGAAGIFITGIGSGTGLTSTVKTENVNIETTGSMGYGVQLLQGGNLLFNNGKIQTQGQQAVGVMSYGMGSDAKIYDSHIVI